MRNNSEVYSESSGCGELEIKEISGYSESAFVQRAYRDLPLNTNKFLDSLLDI